jgi:hypothetical protein
MAQHVESDANDFDSLSISPPLSLQPQMVGCEVKKKSLSTRRLAYAGCTLLFFLNFWSSLQPSFAMFQWQTTAQVLTIVGTCVELKGRQLTLAQCKDIFFGQIMAAMMGNLFGYFMYLLSPWFTLCMNLVASAGAHCMDDYPIIICTPTWLPDFFIAPFYHYGDTTTTPRSDDMKTD